MKKIFTLIATAMMATGVWAQEAVTLLPSGDTFVRKGNTSKQGSAKAMEFGHKPDGSTDFVGLMSFDIPAAPAGYKVSTAVLTLTTERIKGERNTNIYDLATPFVESDVVYADVESAIAAARQTTVLATCKIEGQGQKSVEIDEITTEKYQNIKAWQNDFSLTDFVKANAAKTVYLMIDAAADNANNNKIFCKEAVAGGKNVTFTADEVTPKLVITYVEDADQATAKVLPAADTYIRMGNTADNGSKDNMEIHSTYNEGETPTVDFLGLMSFELPADAKSSDYEIQSVTLRLVTNMCKGATTMNVYPYATFAENTKYADEADKVAAARKTTPVTFTVKFGSRNKSLKDAQAESSSYKAALEKWVNEINLTEMAKAATGTTLNIMIEAGSSNASSAQFFTKEAKGFENTAAGVDYAAEDLVPQLTVVYSKRGTTGIEETVTYETTAKRFDGKAYNIAGQAVGENAKGLIIINGKKYIAR